MLFKSVAIVIGNMEFKILNVFILAMARSTCMWADAISLVSCSSTIVRWSLPLRKGGIFIVTPFGRREWSISKSLSAMNSSVQSIITRVVG